MNPERHELLTNLLDQALDTPAEKRDAFLDAACRDDLQLRRELESLIASLEADPEFIEKPLFSGSAAEALSFDSEPMAGKLIGKYRIVREIGHGGMGSVYLAERADEEYRSQVALKIVRKGLHSNFAMRRFLYERQTLAALHHPNIAALLDGGTTKDGLPYLVMEYVEGEPIDLYCDRQQLPVGERLKLFREVCAAVHYSHQSLIIHRDLKPANLMVTAEGRVKLLDFGIAKILNREIKHTLQQTETAVRLMTPEYASPEQVRGGKITTASDVYSLGVILYELLTGHRPYRIRSWLPSDIEKAICESEPIKPSTAIMRSEEIPAADGGARVITPESVSALRSEPAPKLRRHLSGDLDTIVLTALRKEPERRYASVNALSEDIRRYLEGLPVAARPDTFGYRFGKFARRHKAGVAAVAFILISLAAGLIATIWQARRAEAQQAKAERRFNDVRKLANSYLFEFHDAIIDLPGSTEARGLVAQRALEYLDSLAKEAADDPALQSELAAAYLKVGDVQGRPGHASLGDRTSALASYQKSLAIFDKLSVRDSATLKQMATLLIRMGDTQQSLSSMDSLSSYRRALQTAQSAPEICQREIAVSHQRIAQMLARTGDLNQAMQHLQPSVQMFEAIAAGLNSDDPAVWREAQRDLFIANIRYGDLLLASDDANAARDKYRRALEASKAIAKSEPSNPRFQRELAAAYDKVGNALSALNDKTGALVNYREALRLREPLAKADLKSADNQRDLSISYDKIGGILASAGDTMEAIASFKAALEIDTRLSIADPQNNQTRLDRANSLARLGELHMKLGKVNESLDAHRRAFDLRQEVVKVDAANLDAQRDLADSCISLGELYSKLISAKGEKNSATMMTEAKNKTQRGIEILRGLLQQGAANASDKALLDKAESLRTKLRKRD